MSTATELFDAVITQIKTVAPQGYTSFNPSIHFDGKKWRCLIRHSDYRIAPDHRYYTARNHGIIRNQNSIIEMAMDLSVEKQTPLGDIKTKKPYTKYHCDEFGWFDGRLFQSNDELYIVACSKEWNPNKWHEQILIRVSTMEAQRLDGAWSNTTQKNWTPLDGEFPIQLVQSIDLGNVIIVAEGEIALHGNFEFSGLRGSSPAIKVIDSNDKERIIGVSHNMEMKRPSGIKSYRHCFYELDFASKKIAQSEWFTFGTAPIEYCSGLAYDGDKLVASFGSMDATAHLAVMQLESVLAKLVGR